MNSKIDSDPKEIILLSYPPGGRLFVHTLPIIYEQNGRNSAVLCPRYTLTYYQCKRRTAPEKQKDIVLRWRRWVSAFLDMFEKYWKTSFLAAAAGQIEHELNCGLKRRHDVNFAFVHIAWAFCVHPRNCCRRDAVTRTPVSAAQHEIINAICGRISIRQVRRFRAPGTRCTEYETKNHRLCLRLCHF